MNSHDHHPSEAWLLDFALGNLNPAFETVLDVHVGMCIDCQKTVEMAENIGGEILATLASRSAPATTNDLREAIGRGEFKEGKPSRAVPTVVADSFEHFISTYLNISINALSWRSIGAGLKICRLSNDNDNRLWMLKAQPGTVLPQHSHAGAEFTLVLKGAYFCGSEIFRAGDIEEADEEVRHQPVVTQDSECICLAVTEGDLKFTSLLPRIAQPFIGI